MGAITGKKFVMGKYSEYREEALKNPEVRREYEALQPEYDIIQAIIDARKKAKDDSEGFV